MTTRGQAAMPASPASMVSRRQRLGLLALVGVIYLPHLWHLPLWVSALVGTLLAWQALAMTQRWPIPALWIRALLTFAAVGIVFFSFGQIGGQHAGVALLTLMLGLKLCEVARYRDVIVVLCLCCFALATQFLFSQSLLMAIYLVAGAWLIVAGFVYAHDEPGAARYRVAFAESARLLVWAIPVAALFFALFPRLPGPLWSLPGHDSSHATTGLARSMSPGSVSSLARSNAVAMRVRFDGAPPAPSQRYWRGPVFWDFDDGTWANTHKTPALSPAQIDVRDAPVVADITLAPSDHRWLIALDLPLGVDRAYRRTPGATLRAGDILDQRTRYIARSATAYTLDARLTASARQRALALPGHHNPRARHLAQRWSHSSPTAIVQRALRLFREQPFSYTLKAPPTSKTNSVDDFLFSTRAGFCEHFAGAFTFLMRAAGVPARVVTGFQGATHSTLGDYWIVRNADAHAWAEVWLAGRGWVRVDPTAAVAPSRIQSGVDSAVKDRNALPFMARGASSDTFWYQAGMAWDAINAGWNRWFLAYGPTLQQRLFRRLGLAGASSAIIVLTLGSVALLALISLALGWRMRPARHHDPVTRAWQKIERRLTRAGLPRRRGEAPKAYGQRIAQARPDLADRLHALVEAFIALRYGTSVAAGTRKQFISRAARFRPRRRAAPRKEP